MAFRAVWALSSRALQVATGTVSRFWKPRVPLFTVEGSYGVPFPHPTFPMAVSLNLERVPA